ncbi:hypothetical protein HK102_006694 [Quaeritorhiza haematococci]|nr:hypothetical protein HK102_006694 [Quaeritorhiza haematococci]
MTAETRITPFPSNPEIAKRTKSAMKQGEYEELLDKTMREEEQLSVDIVNAIQELKTKLEMQYRLRRRSLRRRVEGLDGEEE